MLTETEWILLIVVGFFCAFVYLALYLLPFFKTRYGKKSRIRLNFRPDGPLYLIDNWSLTGLGKDTLIPMKIKPIRIDKEGKIIGLLIIQIPKGFVIEKFRFKKDSMDPDGDGFSMFLSFRTPTGIKGEQRWHPDLRPTIYDNGPVYILGRSVAKL
jgi:hypothetical protein